MYFDKGRNRATATMTATHANMTEMTAGIENVGQNISIDHLFSFPDLHDNLLAKTINFFGTVRRNQKGILRDFINELKMRPDDIKTRVRDDLTAIVQKDKRNLNKLTNMHCPLAEGNFLL
jgi:hypothetical protein